MHVRWRTNEVEQCWTWTINYRPEGNEVLQCIMTNGISASMVVGKELKLYRHTCILNMYGTYTNGNR